MLKQSHSLFVRFLHLSLFPWSIQDQRRDDYEQTANMNLVLMGCTIFGDQNKMIRWFWLLCIH